MEVFLLFHFLTKMHRNWYLGWVLDVQTHWSYFASLTVHGVGLAVMCWTFCSRLSAKNFMQNSGFSETGFIVFSQSRVISCCQLCSANRAVGMYTWPWKPATKTSLFLFSYLFFPPIPVASFRVVYCCWDGVIFFSRNLELEFLDH